MEYFSSRRTCRNFKITEISDSIIRDMLRDAAHAPTTGNMQLYSVIITRDTQKKAQLASAHFSQPAYMNAPVILTFCADFNRFTRWCKLSGADPGFDNIQSFVAAALDATILAQQFVTIAEMKGFGTCYLGTTTYNPDKIAEVLKLPTLTVPVISISLGLPEGPLPESDRLDVEAFVFNETYPQIDDETLLNFFAEKEKREDSQKFIRENKKNRLAQVFTDVRYPRSNNEYFSKVFIEFLKQSGFMTD